MQRVIIAVIMVFGPITAILGADYYVDPLKGAMSNKGDAEQPWSTLEAVFIAKKTFVAGDRIVLRRGHHGGPSITGHNAGIVTILPEANHTPIMSSIEFSGAKNWLLQDIFVNAELGQKKAGAAMLELDKSSNIMVNNCGLYSTGNPWGWGADEDGWLKGQRGGLNIGGGSTKNTIHACHFMNTGNGMGSVGAANTIEYCVLENFTRDGVIPIGGQCVWQYNMIMNAIVADYDHAKRVHRDSWQAWERHPGVIIRGNITIAATDLKQPLVFPGSPGFAGWNGPFEKWVFENNVFFTDSLAGINICNASDCIIINNTVLPMTSGDPAIRIYPKGGKNSGNIVFNNISAKYVFTPNPDGSSLGEMGNNLLFKPAMFLAFGKGKRDVHLAAPLPGNPLHSSNSDGDGKSRPKNKGDLPDLGAYEYGFYTGADMSPPSTPSKLRVIMIPDLGADLQWTASTDNRSVAGYDIYRNGVRIGRTRNGPRYCDVYKDKTKVIYSVMAFDDSGNKSGMSAAGTIPKSP